jgi:hypothetical protein
MSKSGLPGLGFQSLGIRGVIGHYWRQKPSFLNVNPGDSTPKASPLSEDTITEQSPAEALTSILRHSAERSAPAGTQYSSLHAMKVNIDLIRKTVRPLRSQR